MAANNEENEALLTTQLMQATQRATELQGKLDDTKTALQAARYDRDDMAMKETGMRQKLAEVESKNMRGSESEMLLAAELKAVSEKAHVMEMELNKARVEQDLVARSVTTADAQREAEMEAEIHRLQNAVAMQSARIEEQAARKHPILKPPDHRRKIPSFDEIDRNGDGVIDRNEWAAVAPPGMPPPGMPPPGVPPGPRPNGDHLLRPGMHRPGGIPFAGGAKRAGSRSRSRSKKDRQSRLASVHDLINAAVKGDVPQLSNLLKEGTGGMIP
jgi:hypothetical protein